MGEAKRREKLDPTFGTSLVQKASGTITPEIVNKIAPTPSKETFSIEPNIGQIHQIARSTEHLVLALHWVVKLDWDSKHKIPANRKTQEAIKPLGVYFYEIFQLCIAVHARQNTLPSPLPYQNASEWFQVICKQRLEEINAAVLLPREEAFNTVANGEVKRKMIRDISSYPRLVEQGQNPLKENIFLSSLSELIDSAIILSQQSSVFKDKHLKSFTTAWKLALKEIESPRWQHQFVKDGALRQQRSGSKGTINLSASEKYFSGTLTPQGIATLPAKS